MPRYPDQASLRPLKKLIPRFKGLTKAQPKFAQVADLLRSVINANRSTRNQVFYSTRDVAEFFEVSQNTAALTMRALEREGLLRLVRGSHTLIIGTKVITRTHIRAVAGLMSWRFAQRYSEIQGDLTHDLAEALWPHHIALEIIPHFDLGDNRPDLDERLKKHSLDFVLWPFPFEHHKDHMLHLQDRGIRNLVIGVGGVRSSFESHIVVDYVSAYKNLLLYWRDKYGIRRVIVVQPREFTPRRRLALFAKTATEMGFECCVETNSYTLPAELLARESRQVGIALLDEHATAEFTFYDPPSFVGLVRRHRILYGAGSINVPFVPNGELQIERIFVPTETNQKFPRNSLVPAISRTLVQWCSGDFNAPTQKVRAVFWENGNLWRYL